MVGPVEEPLPQPSPEEPEPKKTRRGRPPIKGEAMSSAERKRRERARERALKPIRPIIKELEKIRGKVSYRVWVELISMVKLSIRQRRDENGTLMELLKQIRSQIKDDRAKHRPQGWFMKDAPPGKGLLLTGEYTGEKLALIDAYQNPGWDGERSTFGLATKRPVAESRKRKSQGGNRRRCIS